MVQVTQHIWQLFLLLCVAGGPIPLCLFLVIQGADRGGRPRLAHRLLVLLSWWCILQVAIGLLLGSLRLLSLPVLLAIEMAILLAGTALLLRSIRPSPFAARADPTSAHLPHPSTTQAGGTTALSRDRFSDGAYLSLPDGGGHSSDSLSRRLFQPSRRWTNPEWAIVISAGCVGLYLLVRLATRLVDDYDSLAYHLPTMARWYQTGSLEMLEQFADQISRYSYNWEVLGTLLLIPLGDDFLVALPNLVAWLLLGLAVYLLSIEIGSARVHALAAASLLLSLPLLLEHVDMIGVDLPLAAFFVTGLYLAFSYVCTGARADLALLLATLGMLAGTKTSGPVYGLLIVAALAFMRIKSRRSRPAPGLIAPEGKSQGLSLTLLGLVCFLFLGGFWYARNLLGYGNPLGFVRLEFGGVVILPGSLTLDEIRRTTLAAMFDPTSLGHWRILVDQARERLQAPFFVLVFEAALLPLAILAGRKHLRNWSLATLTILLVAAAYLYWTTPYSGNVGSHQWTVTPLIGFGVRFAFPFLSILAVLAAISASAVRVPAEMATAFVVMAAGMAIARIAGVLYLLIALLLSGWVALWLVRRLSPVVSSSRFLVRLGPPVVALTLAVLLVSASFVVRERKSAQRSSAYGGVQEYIARSVRADETIGYLLSERSYPFYGPDLKKKVVWLPADGDDARGWIDKLRGRGVAVVAVGPLRHLDEWKTSKELSWLRDPDGPFVRVYGQDIDAEPLLYRFK